VGLPEFRWDKGTVITRDYNCFYGKETKIINLEQEFLQNRRVSKVKGVESLSDRISYIVLRSRWFNIIVLNCMHPVRRKVMIQKTVL